MMALSSLAMDLMLPTFPDIRAEFGMTPDSAQVGWIITAYFLGLAVVHGCTGRPATGTAAAGPCSAA